MRISDWSSDVCSSDLDGVGAESGHVAPDTHDAPGSREGHYVANAAAKMRHDLQAGRVSETPFLEVGEEHAGFVVNLVAPALRPVGTDDPVPRGLHFLTQRRGPDHAEVELDGLQPILRNALRDAAHVEPGGPRAVERLRARYREDRKSTRLNSSH